MNYPSDKLLRLVVDHFDAKCRLKNNCFKKSSQKYEGCIFEIITRGTEQMNIQVKSITFRSSHFYQFFYVSKCLKQLVRVIIFVVVPLYSFCRSF